MTRKFTFPAFKRLKSQKQIAKLFEKSESQFIYPFKLLYLKEQVKEDIDSPVKFTISVPKKKINSAVQRNLIKRRTKEAYRIHNETLLDKIYQSDGMQVSLMFVFIENQVLEYTIIEKSIVKHLKKLIDEMVF